MKAAQALRAICGAVLATASLVGQPADRVELQALRAQVQELEQRLRELSRKLEIKEQAAAPVQEPAREVAAKVSVTDRGYSLASPDSANVIRLRALLHLDARVFFSDDDRQVNDMFLLRRARITTEGTLATNYGYQFVTDFGGASAAIPDANFTVRVADALHFKFGKFKSPVGLELLQSTSATSFTERSLVTRLVPNRDVGIQIGGGLRQGTLNYTVAVLNGLADGTSSTNVDFDEEVDVAARLMAGPFRNAPDSPWRRLAFGLSGIRGVHRTVAGRTAGYRSDGNQIFFAYHPSVVADGDAWRISPQLDYRFGPLGVMAEYVVSSAELRATAVGPRTKVRHEGWQLTTGYVLTGEDSTYGDVVPRVGFDPAAGTWGAFEVFGRIAEVDLDDAAFSTLASAALSATDVQSYALGLNWYLSKAVVFKFNYFQSQFGRHPAADGSVTSGVLRQPEKAFVSRFQLAF